MVGEFSCEGNVCGIFFLDLFVTQLKIEQIERIFGVKLTNHFKKPKFTHLDIGEINCLECFEHAVKRMKTNFFHSQEKALKSQRTENR